LKVGMITKALSIGRGKNTKSLEIKWKLKYFLNFIACFNGPKNYNRNKIG